jgi:Zn-dependent M28 family amino/carboxypeptidase
LSAATHSHGRPAADTGAQARAMITVKNLKRHVQILAGDIGERNPFKPEALHHAEEYIAQVWHAQGYNVVRQEYELKGERWANLEITRAGREKETSVLLIGAHYDSVIGSPGANDNGTGVAALLEISNTFAALDPQTSVRFVAFVNEEPPYFQTPFMGSRIYAQKARDRGDRIRVMASLETIGYYSDAPASQKFPFPSALFRLLYPDRGNFIVFVSNLPSRTVTQEAHRLFHAHSNFPAETISTLEMVPGIDWSDHASFWGVGYPAFMVTDTAPYRYPYYHTAEDTPDKVNYQALGRVAEGLRATFQGLAR